MIDLFTLSTSLAVVTVVITIIGLIIKKKAIFFIAGVIGLISIILFAIVATLDPSAVQLNYVLIVGFIAITALHFLVAKLY
jgi:hypothetical protein